MWSELLFWFQVKFLFFLHLLGLGGKWWRFLDTGGTKSDTIINYFFSSLKKKLGQKDHEGGGFFLFVTCNLAPESQ